MFIPSTNANRVSDEDMTILRVIHIAKAQKDFSEKLKAEVVAPTNGENGTKRSIVKCILILRMYHRNRNKRKQYEICIEW